MKDIFLGCMVTVVWEVKHCEGSARHCDDHVRHDGLLQSGVGEGTMLHAVRPLAPTCDSLTTVLMVRAMWHHSCPLSIILSWKHTCTVCNNSIHSLCTGSYECGVINCILGLLLSEFVIVVMSLAVTEEEVALSMSPCTKFTFWAILKRCLSKCLDRFVLKRAYIHSVQRQWSV